MTDTYASVRRALLQWLPRGREEVPRLSAGCCGRRSGPADEAWEAIFLLSRARFEEGNAAHEELLRALYAAASGSAEPAARRGAHWEQIGFQSHDPVTDLRATGLMGLLLPLELFARCQRLGERMRSAAAAPDRGFPMMIVMIVLVKGAIEAAGTKGILAGDDFDSCWERMLLFFAGEVDEVCTMWCEKQCSLASDFGLFDAVQRKCIARPLAAIRRGESVFQNNGDVVML